MTNYNNLSDGAKGLLGDCVNILSSFNKDYVIVGGWSPLLLNSGIIKHPGTHDVDLLFTDGKKEGELNDVFNLFLKNGYMTSAKHNFQLLKILMIKGREFVYNVDFLHSSDNSLKEDMFVDHLRLPIPLNEYQNNNYLSMSIKAPNSEVLFTEKLFDNITETFLLPDGTKTELSFPLINEAGLIITKTESVKMVKRKRDAFDIYLAIKQARNLQELIQIFKTIKKKNPELFNTLYGIREAIDKHGMISNVIEFVSEKPEKIRSELESFLENVGLEIKAKRFYT